MYLSRVTATLIHMGPQAIARNRTWNSTASGFLRRKRSLFASLRQLYLRASDGTSHSLETAWNVLRLILAIILIPTAILMMGGVSGGLGIIVGCFAVLLTAALIGVLLRRGQLRPAMLIGFALDTIVIFGAWWLTVEVYRPDGVQSDMWLSLMPIAILSVARTGLVMGSLYLGVLVTGLVVMTLAFEAPGSYGYEQLPVRAIFLGTVGGIGAWLVAALKREREAAHGLQREAEGLANISQVVSSSLDLGHVYPELAPLARKMVPYDVMLLLGVGQEDEYVQVLGVDAPRPGSVDWSTIVQIWTGFDGLDCLSLRETRLMPVDHCSSLTDCRSSGGARVFADTESLLVAPVVSGDRTSASLVAFSFQADVFTTDHARVFGRLAEIIGSGMANMEVYSQAIQLANEREARLTLDAANRKLQEENEAQSAFLSAISHELRTPLTSIIAFNDLILKHREDLSERNQKHLDVIRRNSRQLALLVDDLLDLSRLGSSKAGLRPEVFDVSDAIDHMTESFKPIFDSRSQRLKLTTSTGKATLIADRDRLGQVVGNILSNASKYSPEKSDIDLSWQLIDDRFEMECRDYGSGISDEDLPRVFDPFYRSQQHRIEKIPGTGLGLVIARSLLDAHGGGISIKPCGDHDEGGRGTLVKIWLPADGSGISSAIPPGKSA